MDKKDKQISIVLQRLYDHYRDSHIIGERRGMITRGAFFSVCGKYLERATDNRTRANLWTLAHERGYLEPAPVERTFNGLLIGEGRSYVRSDLWECHGCIEALALDQLHALLSSPERAGA